MVLMVIFGYKGKLNLIKIKIMKKKLIYFLMSCSLILGLVINFQLFKESKTNAVSLNSIALMARASAEDGGYNICYYESKVRTGETYYDCGTCEKVYDEEGINRYTKCFE